MYGRPRGGQAVPVTLPRPLWSLEGLMSRSLGIPFWASPVVLWMRNLE